MRYILYVADFKSALIRIAIPSALMALCQGLGLLLSLYLYSKFARRSVLFSSMIAVTIGLLMIAYAFTRIG